MKKLFEEIPQHWRIAKIPEILHFQEGPGVRKNQFTPKGIKLLNVGNINKKKIDLEATDKYISEDEAINKYSHFLVDAGDLLIACSGVVVSNFHNKIAFAEEKHLPLCLNTSTMRFKVKDEESVDLNYFKYFLQTFFFKRQLQKLITGSAQLNFGPSHIKKIELPLPPLKTQKKITAVLDKAEGLIQFNRDLIKKYDKLKQSIFQDMFGDPINNQKDWQLKRLRDISQQISSGNTPKGGSNVYVDHGIMFFRSQNVWRNRIKYDNLVFIDEKIHSKIKNNSLKKGDILMTKTGRINTENSSLGRAAMFLGENHTANINGHVYLVRLKEGVENDFILFILTTKSYREYIRKTCVGGIDKRQINKEHLQNFPIIYPPVELQRQFVDKLASIDKQKILAQRALEKSEELFQSLLQKAFKGELTKENNYETA